MPNDLNFALHSPALLKQFILFHERNRLIFDLLHVQNVRMPGGFADIFRCSVWNIKMGAAVFHALCNFVLQLCGVFVVFRRNSLCFDILQKNLTVTVHFIKSYFRMMTRAETYDIIKAILSIFSCLVILMQEKKEVLIWFKKY